MRACGRAGVRAAGQKIPVSMQAMSFTRWLIGQAACGGHHSSVAPAPPERNRSITHRGLDGASITILSHNFPTKQSREIAGVCTSKVMSNRLAPMSYRKGPEHLLVLVANERRDCLAPVQRGHAETRGDRARDRGRGHQCCHRQEATGTSGSARVQACAGTDRQDRARCCADRCGARCASPPLRRGHAGGPQAEGVVNCCPFACPLACGCSPGFTCTLAGFRTAVPANVSPADHPGELPHRLSGRCGHRQRQMAPD